MTETTSLTEDVILERNPLLLDLSDDILAAHMDDVVREYDEYISDNDVKSRREKNRDYLRGNQIDTTKLKPYQARYVDNIIYEAEATIKPIALSRMPDLLAQPGSDTEDSRKTARTLTEAINSDIKKRSNRKLYGIAHKHLPVFLTACVKAIWDNELDEYRFRTVHPDNLVFDSSCATNDVEDMEFIGEYAEYSIKELVGMFPKKKAELLKVLKYSEDDSKRDSKMSSKIRVLELWFDYPKLVSDPETGEDRYETVSCVAWKYKAVILGKMKHPYYDWEGKKHLYTLEMGKKRELTDDEIREKMMSELGLNQPGLSEETIYRNYFKLPLKPYYLFGYDQFGESPLDFTSRIEQVIYQQDTVNKRGRQITEMNDRAKGKHVFNSMAIDKKDVEAMDLDNPDEDIMVKDDIRLAHTYIKGEPAPAQLYQDQEQERQKAFQKMGTNSTTRGVREKEETATGRQLLREADFGKIDDLVEETINACAEWQAGWILQFIKLFYTRDHVKRIVGRDGDVVFARLNQDSVEDGMEVVMTASGVDKMQRKKEAYQRAEMGLTDPLNFFVDTEVPDPIGRTRALILSQMAPELYLKEVVEKMSPEQMAMQLQTQPMGMGQPQQGQPAAQPLPGSAPQPPLANQGGGGPGNQDDPLGLFA